MQRRRPHQPCPCPSHKKSYSTVAGPHLDNAEQISSGVAAGVNPNLNLSPLTLTLTRDLRPHLDSAEHVSQQHEQLLQRRQQQVHARHLRAPAVANETGIVSVLDQNAGKGVDKSPEALQMVRSLGANALCILLLRDMRACLDCPKTSPQTCPSECTRGNESPQDITKTPPALTGRLAWASPCPFLPLGACLEM